jgi:hypothetical protein
LASIIALPGITPSLTLDYRMLQNVTEIGSVRLLRLEPNTILHFLSRERSVSTFLLR